MMRIIVLFLFAVFLGLICYAQSFDMNSNYQAPNTNFCTGGACRIDKMNQNPFSQSDTVHSNFQYNFSDRANDSHNRGGLNNNSNFTYDFNCQFGNCLPSPSGSYQP